MESDKKITTELSPKNLDPISFFDKDSEFIFVYKKTEKLASAVYMVTSLFSESEPMKGTLRKKVSDLVSFMVDFKESNDGGQQDVLYHTRIKVLEIVSFLEISFRGGLISEMNFNVLKQEFINLLELLNTSPSSRSGFHSPISKTFFADEVDQEHLKNTLDQRNYHIISHQNQIGKIVIDEQRARSMPFKKDFKKSNRQTIILDLLKKKKELTIKDIAEVIKNCSQKTIQRELNSFISVGVLKRTGVRRWSKYSLNQ